MYLTTQVKNHWKKGIGADQIEKAQLSTHKILKVLEDGNWHRYMEILRETKISPTTLTKRLRELEKGIVERKINIETKEYPPPVEYHLRNKAIESMRKGEIGILEKLMANIGRNKSSESSAIIDFLEDFSFLMELHILENLSSYFIEKNETYYRQYFEYYVIPNFTEIVIMLKQKLSNLEGEGSNIEDLLSEAKARLVKLEDQKVKKRVVKLDK